MESGGRIQWANEKLQLIKVASVCQQEQEGTESVHGSWMAKSGSQELNL